MELSEHNEHDSNSRASIKSLNKVLQVLECFSPREANLTPAEISMRTGLPRATTHRLASSLREIGLLEQNGKRDTYKLGMKLFQLGSLVIANLNMDTHAKPHVTKLQKITGEATHLCIYDGFQMALVDRQEMAASSNTVITRIESAPVYCTGVGKAFLAFQDQITIEKVVSNGLVQRTTHTLIGRESLIAAMLEIRSRGYSIDDEENQYGVRCVAAPIRDSNGRVFAAISVSGAADRLPDSRIEGLAPLVIETADAISFEFGWNPGKKSHAPMTG